MDWRVASSVGQPGKILAVDGTLLSRGAARIRIPLWGWITLAAVLLTVGGFAAHGFDENGLRLGSQLAWRFACVAYFAAIIAGPATRMVPWAPLHRAGQKRRQIVWGFCASFGVFIASLIVPNTLALPSLDHEGLTFGMALFAILGGVLTAVIAYAAVPRANLGEQSRRTILGVGLSYFWLAYTLTGLSHLSGPHRPDAFYGFSLVLMLVGLLVRFLDRFVTNTHGSSDGPQS